MEGGRILSRIYKWDYLKFFLIFLVVLGHAADRYTADSSIMRSLFVFIYAFHMPAFMFVSGLFSKRTIDQARYKRAFSFLYLFISMKLIVAATNFIESGDYTAHIFEEPGIPWFAFALFVFYLVGISVRRLDSRFVLVVAVLIALFVGTETEYLDFLVVGRIAVFFPFFYLGYLVDQRSVAQFASRFWMRLVSAVVFLGFGLLCFLRPDQMYWFRKAFTGRNAYATFGDLAVWGPFIRLGHLLLALVLILALISLMPDRTRGSYSKAEQVIAGFGARSMQVYLLHVPTLAIFFSILRKQDVLEWGSFPVRGIVIVTIAVITTLVLSTSYFGKLTELLSQPKFAAALIAE